MSRVIKIRQEQVLSREEMLEQFILWKKAQGISETTAKDYNYHVNAFFRKYPDAWDNLSNCILKYMAENIKPATYNLRLIYLRAFFQFCSENGHIVINPLNGFKRKKTQDRIVDIPENILEKLLKLPDQTTFSGLRDYSLIVFTLDTGIRPKEAFSLKPAHFNFEQLAVTIPAEAAKTRKERVLPILLVTAEKIKQLINAHHPDWRDSPVFCTYEGKQMNRHIWNDRLEIYSKKLSYKIRPYDLRHAFAVLYLRKGGHAFSLQNTLGHEDMSMTRKYVHLSGQDLRDIHRTASPINSLLNKNRCRKRKIN